jgi:hypothetical protein
VVSFLVFISDKKSIFLISKPKKELWLGTKDNPIKAIVLNKINKKGL